MPDLTRPLRPAAGPYAVIVNADRIRTYARALRRAFADHDDTAWVHPPPTRERDNLAAFSQTLIDAIGVVGLAPPRAVGERHLLRAATHLTHGPVRHIAVNDAAILGPDTLAELHQTAQLAGTAVWLVIDIAGVQGGDRRHAARTDLLNWVEGTCTPVAPTQALDAWQQRPRHAPHCINHPLDWWTTPLDLSAPLPPACPQHRRVECLLASIRRGLATGRTTPSLARQRLIEYVGHPDITTDDWWDRTGAGKDFWTPGTDALGQLHPAAPDATIADVAADGSVVICAGEPVAVPESLRPAIARLRTSRRLAGCLPHEPVAGVFDITPGVRGPRRR